MQTAAFLEVDCEYHEQYEQARRQGRGPSTSGTTALVAVIQGDQLVTLLCRAPRGCLLLLCLLKPCSSAQRQWCEPARY